MLKRMIRTIFFLPLKLYKLKKINVKVHNITSIDIASEFEGENYIEANSKIRNSVLGYGTYIGTNTTLANCIVKKFVSIGPNVTIIYGQHPTRKFVSTHPAFYSPKPKRLSFTDEKLFEEFRYADPERKTSVIIGNDVWIGAGVKIMEGIQIGDGAIVATGSIVTKDVPNYAIVAGIPAKIIRYRFDEKQIIFLNKLKWWDKDISWLRNNASIFSNIITLYEKYNKE